MKKLLKTKLESLKVREMPGEDVKTFTTKLLQRCIDLRRNVPGDAPFLLNEQFCVSSIEQFHVKFSTEINKWVTKFHGLSKTPIDSKSLDSVFVSVQDLVEDNAEYTLLLTANQWGPKGKVDSENAPGALTFTKMEINNLVQKQVSAVLKHQGGGGRKGTGKGGNKS